ncbi:putative odorant receptor 85d isoform X2 [Augochlora pura]
MTGKHPIAIKDSLLYCQLIFSVGGILPLHESTPLFKIVVFYFVQLAVLQLWDLYDVLHDFEGLIENVSVLPLTLTIPFALVLIRTNKKLSVVIKKIRSDIKGAILFENDEEKRLYQKYNNISFYFGKYVSIFTFVNTYMMYIRPLIGLVIYTLADHGNNTRPYELPFPVHMFLDYHYDPKIYTIIYIYQFPAGFVGMYHAAEASLIVTSTLHICGKLSMLACRIRMSLTKSPMHFRQRMKTMVLEHLELMKLTDFLNDCFCHILLLEYLNCSFRLGVTMYVVLITFGRDMVAAINFILYSIIVAAWLYLYSYIGEQLVQESQEVGDAFYDTVWTDIENHDKRSLVMCLRNGQRPQYLMAGKFYRFTLFGFSDIVKTSMALLSVLRTRVE